MRFWHFFKKYGPAVLYIGIRNQYLLPPVMAFGKSYALFCLSRRRKGISAME